MTTPPHLHKQLDRLDPDAPNPARGCRAGDLVPARFRAKARIWRERHHRAGIEARHIRGAADRRVEYAPDRDGMAWLSAYLPADTAAGVWERTTAAARALQGPAEARDLSQLRADITATWLLTGTGTNSTCPGTIRGTAAGGKAGCETAGTCPGTNCGTVDGGTAGSGTCPGTNCGTTRPGTGTGTCAVWGGGVPSPRAQVLVTVPVLALLGATDEPAVLDGYGPIPPSMARRLITEGADSFYRVLIDPRDGAPLEIGRSSYRVTKAQRQLASPARWQVPVPGLQQPFPGQRGRSSPGLGRRRQHRHHQPGPALPETPPPQTRLRLDTRRSRQRTARRAGPHRPAGTTPASTRTGNRPTGPSTSRPRTPPRSPGSGRMKHLNPTRAGIPAGVPKRTCPATPSRTGVPARIPNRTCPRTRTRVPAEIWNRNGSQTRNGNPAGVPKRTCLRIPSRTGTNSPPRIRCPPRTRTIRAGWRPARRSLAGTLPSPMWLIDKRETEPASMPSKVLRWTLRTQGSPAQAIGPRPESQS